jgi:hypothetical protein
MTRFARLSGRRLPTLAGVLRRRFPGQADTWLAIGVLAASAIAWLALEGHAYPPPDPYATGDYAKIELYTRLAAEGSQRLGTESRFHIHQPGPSFFYAAAPIYELMGESVRGMTVAALVWNLVSLGGMVALAGWLAPGTGAFLAALLLALFIGGRGLGWLFSSWNPNVAMLPFGVLLLASARLATGDARALPLVALAASLVVQNHLAWTLPAAAAVAFGLVLACWPSLRRVAGVPTMGSGPGRSTVAGALILLAILWALPALDEVTGPYRNLHRIAAMRGPAEPRPWADALVAATRGLASFAGRPRGPDYDPRPPATDQGANSMRTAGALEARDVVPVVLVGAGLVVAGRHAARRASPLAALAWVTGLGFVAAPLVARYAPGRVLPFYVLQWAGVVTMAALLLILGELLTLAPRRAATIGRALGLAALGLVPAFLLASAWLQSRGPTEPPRDPASAVVERLATTIRAQVPDPHRRFLLRVAPHEDQWIVVGLILALDKARLRFAVEPFGSCRIEGRFTPRGDEWGELLLGDIAAAPGARRLVESDPLSVVWQPPRGSGAPDPARR